MNKQAYRQGFNEACIYYGVAPEQVLNFTKEAGGLGSIAKGIRGAGKVLSKSKAVKSVGSLASKAMGSTGKAIGSVGKGRKGGTGILRFLGSVSKAGRGGRAVGTGIAGLAERGAKVLGRGGAKLQTLKEAIRRSLIKGNPLGRATARTNKGIRSAINAKYDPKIAKLDALWGQPGAERAANSLARAKNTALAKQLIQQNWLNSTAGGSLAQYGAIGAGGAGAIAGAGFGAKSIYDRYND